MAHLIYHQGDRYTFDHPARDLDIEDQAVIDYLLGATHTDGSPIWTLDKPEPEPAPTSPVAPPAPAPEQPAKSVNVSAADGGMATTKAG